MRWPDDPKAMISRGRSTGHIAYAYKRPKLKSVREVRKPSKSLPSIDSLFIPRVKDPECRLLGKCGEKVPELFGPPLTATNAHLEKLPRACLRAGLPGVRLAGKCKIFEPERLKFQGT